MFLGRVFLGQFINIKQNMQSDGQKDKYRALFILAALGDAVGYNRGNWEFCKSGPLIHSEFYQLTNGKGMQEFTINSKWIFSDDTVMHIATAKALIEIFEKPQAQTGKVLAREYLDCWKYMGGRAPGSTTSKSINIIKNNIQNWKKITYSRYSGGCGAAMRTACIGAVYRKDLDQLVRVSLQASRITHNNGVAYLGGVTSAYFSYLALESVDVRLWAAKLLKECIPIVRKFTGQEYQKNKQMAEDQKYFIQKWENYIQTRKLSIDLEKPQDPQFPQSYNVSRRDQFYEEISYHGWGGSSGHDSVIIAYDALLGCKADWNQFCLRGVLHGGDNDSTGAIGGSWFGALYGMQKIPEKNYKQLQQILLLETLGSRIYEISKKKNG